MWKTIGQTNAASITRSALSWLSLRIISRRDLCEWLTVTGGFMYWLWTEMYPAHEGDLLLKKIIQVMGEDYILHSRLNILLEGTLKSVCTWHRAGWERLADIFSIYYTKPEKNKLSLIQVHFYYFKLRILVCLSVGLCTLRGQRHWVSGSWSYRGF